jgi:hypothetical protein
MNVHQGHHSDLQNRSIRVSSPDSALEPRFRWIGLVVLAIGGIAVVAWVSFLLSLFVRLV